MLSRLLGNRNFEKDKDRLMIGGKGVGTADRMFSPITGNEYPNFVAPMRGYNSTDGTYIALELGGTGAAYYYFGCKFPPDKSCLARGTFITPLYFTGDLMVYSLYALDTELVTYPPQTYNFRTAAVVWAKVEEARNPWTIYETEETSYTETITPEHVGVHHVAGLHMFVSEQNFITLTANRRGLDATDDSNSTAIFLGWWILYTAQETELELA